MRIIKTKTTYLEMHEAPSTTALPPRPDVEIERANRPDPDFYRYLYRSVGAAFQWVDRLRLTDDELRAMIHDDQVDIFVLRVGGDAAGFSELDRREPNEIELKYFGLFAAFLGQGLGKYFLNWTLHQAWSYGPSRVWVHTCDLDHPAALTTYRKAGFRIFDQRLIDQALPEDPVA